MLLTKNAVKNLINKYKAVLMNCHLLNIFGTLAIVIAMPSVALGALAEITSTVEVNQSTPWVSASDISISSTTGAVKGIKITAKTNDVTLQSAHTLTVTSEGDGTDAYGMYGIGDFNKLTNAGSMRVTVKGADTDAYGMQVTSSPAHNTVSNTGSITVMADGNNVHAYGMKGDGTDSENIFSNSGTMTVTAKGTGNAHGMFGNCFTNTLSNSGIMTVTSAGGRPAYGMSVWRGESTLNNTGDITVSGGKAYQAYVKAGTAYIGTWALKLGESYGAAGSGYHVFGAGNSGKLVFGEGGKGATLIITGKGDAFVEGTEYAISDMVDIASDTPSKPGMPSKPSGTVTGYIEKVTSSYAFLEVELVDKGTASDYTDQYIKGAVHVTDDNSPSQSVSAQTVSGMRNNLNQLRNIVDGQTRATGERLDFGKRNVGSEAQNATATMYASASTSFPDVGGNIPEAGNSYAAQESPVWKTFLTPYYSQYGANNGSYDGHVHGIAMGATRQISAGFALGAHFGLSKGIGDSALTDTNATTYTFGAHAVYSVGEALFFRGQVSGFMAENDLDMVGSLAKLTHANTDMGTAGVYAMIAAGYDMALNDKHFLTPELGLSYFYAYMDGFSTDFYNTAGTKDAAISMASESYDVWYADATLRWTGVFAMDKGVLKPTVKAGVRQALTDPDVSSTMRFGSATATTYSDANDTALLCEAGLSWEYDGITLSATYSGEFGNVEYSHMGMCKAEWMF